MWLGMVTASITFPLIMLLLNVNVFGYWHYGYPEAVTRSDQSYIPFQLPMTHQLCHWQNQWIDRCYLLNNFFANLNVMRDTAIPNLRGWFLRPNYVQPLWLDKYKYSEPKVFYNKVDFMDVNRPLNGRRSQQQNNPTPTRPDHNRTNVEVSSTIEDVNKLNLTKNIQINDVPKLAGNPEHSAEDSLALFKKALNNFQKQLHLTTFKKLAAISPKERQENGVSFTYSSLFLLLHLMALTNEVDSATAAEILQVIGLNTSYKETLKLISEVVSILPVTSKKLRFPWASRLIVHPSVKLSRTMQVEVVQAMRLQITNLRGNETAEYLTTELNNMVDLDSGGAMHDGFEEEDVSSGVRAILLTTLCLRPTWHIAPTLLNGTWSFYDAPNAPNRTTRMIRLNDVMKYADLKELNAQVVEINYATPGLSILIIIPRGSSLRQLMTDLVATDIDNISDKMQKTRVSVSLPIYTLRMTLLLQNKLADLGITQLTNWNSTSDDSLRVSHAVQRLMFWSEPGRHAFKDDGIDWDGTPDLTIFVDRPYVFHVRWQNLTLLSGNFVL